MGTRYFLAIDIGASSGRHILGHVDNGRIALEEVYRFDNTQVRRNGHDCWDVESLFANVVAGMRKCGEIGKIPETVAIDTWGVDFVLLDRDLRPCSDAVAYRDARTEGIDAVVEAAVPAAELYSRTGIQKMPFNTVYQLAALSREDPAALEKAGYMLLIPEYLSFRLTGKIVHDYTNATTTSLVDAVRKDWDFTTIDKLGLPRRIFGPLSMPGTAIGPLLPDVAAAAGFTCEVILTASHDTASAYLAVPARDDQAVYISSGTWSLLGVENTAPITTEASRQANFTNEGGYAYRFRYLKNIMGLWMIQSIRRELNGDAYVKGKDVSGAAPDAGAPSATPFLRAGATYSYSDLERLARDDSYAGTVDVTDNRFMAPDSMIREVCAALAEKGEPAPATVGALMRCVYRSLAQCYARAIQLLSSVTGKRYTSINIVGGGCKDRFLNELTAEATGLEVFAGPVEGTAIGNLIVQFLAAGVFGSLEEARKGI